MKKIILGLSFLVVVGCKNDQKNSEENKIAEEIPSTEITDGHTTQNSVDWSGTYKGILPCADCSGIETTITLNADGTYVLKQHYLDVEDQQNEFVEKGKFSWSEDGQKINLKGTEDGPSKYFVGENYMLVLKLDGTKVTGALAEHYKLTKQ